MSADGEGRVVEEPGLSLSPLKKAPLSEISSEVPSSTTTVKGSRRAKGWLSAVGGGGSGDGGTIDFPRSGRDAKALNGSLTISSAPRKGSVRFSKDTIGSEGFPTAANVTRNRPREEAAGFRQSMTDFLTVMYGDATVGNTIRGSGKGACAARDNAGKGEREAFSFPRPSHKGRQLPLTSPLGMPPGPRGSQVKGPAANGGLYRHDDRLDTLVETLAQAYSHRTICGQEDHHHHHLPNNHLHSPWAKDEYPAGNYQSRTSRFRRAIASPRMSLGGRPNTASRHDSDELSVFVSQAMDSFLGSGGRRGTAGMNSTISVLSSLGLDRNRFHLMPFPTQSHLNLAEGEDEEDSDMVLQPMYIGEQALFHSVGTRPNMSDISVSKSMGAMCASPPPPAPDPIIEREPLPATTTVGGGGARIAARRIIGGVVQPIPFQQDLNSDMLSLVSEDVAAAAGQDTSQNLSTLKVHPFNKGLTQSMSLDSKALCEGVNVRGGANESCSQDLPDSSAGKAAEDGGPTVVSTTRSLLNYSKARTCAALEESIAALQEEEELKRGVILAVELQLRGYVLALESDVRSWERGTTAFKSATGGAGGEILLGRPAAEGSLVVDATTEASTSSSRAVLQGPPAPPTPSVVDFLERGSDAVNHSLCQQYELKKATSIA